MKFLARLPSMCAALLAVLILGSCGDAPQVTPRLDGRTAGSATAGFSLFSDGSHHIVVTGDVVTPVKISADQVDSGLGLQAAAIDAEHLVVTGDGLLTIIAADASARSVACDSCTGVAWSGVDLVLVRSSGGDGQPFILERYSRDLVRITTTKAWPQTERTDPDQERNVQSAELLAASPSTAWVAYTDRFGFARGGSRTIAAYSRDGVLLATNRVRGTIYQSSLSDDGRYLALADGGSGGACITVGELDVLDLTTMRSLDTSPRIPPKALLEADPDDVPDVTFAASRLVWQGATVAALGETSRGNAPGDSGATGCDPEAKQWIRRYDTQFQTFQDTEERGASDLIVGPTCADRARRGLSSGWEFTARSTPVRRLDESMDVIYSPPMPQCLERR